MSYIGQAPGLGQRTAFRFVANPGQTTFSGPDANGYPLGYTPGLVDIYLNGRLLSEPDVTAGDGSTIIIAAQLNANDEVRVLAQAPFSPANTYTMTQADSFQQRRNRIIDPGMRISQENGSNAGALTASPSTFYASDSFSGYRFGTAGNATVQRVVAQSPGGSPYRVRMTVTTAASVASSDLLAFSTSMEGFDVSDLRFGTGSSKTIAVRFGCRASVAGTYSVNLRNRDYNRSWLGSVTIAPNEVGLDVVKSVSLVGDASGTWDYGFGMGLTMLIVLAAGPAIMGVAGWQSGNMNALSGQVNMLATVGSTFELFDVGLYDVTGLQPGVIPPFGMGSYAEDLAKCQRYYEQVVAYQVGTNGTANGGYSGIHYKYKVTKRVSPTVSLVAPIQSTNVNQNIYLEAGGNYADGFTATVNYAANNTWAAGGIFAGNARL